MFYASKRFKPIEFTSSSIADASFSRYNAKTPNSKTFMLSKKKKRVFSHFATLQLERTISRSLNFASILFR